MRQRAIKPLWGICFLALAACAQTSVPPAPHSNVLVSAAEAVDLFYRICLGTAPDFVGSRARMESAGLTQIGRNGASYDNTGTVSAKIQTRSEAGGITVERCSVVFEDPDGAAARAALNSTIKESGLALGPFRQGAIGSRTVDIWDLSIDGRTARVIFAPARSERLLGGIYLDIPSQNASA